MLNNIIINTFSHSHGLLINPDNILMSPIFVLIIILLLCLIEFTLFVMLQKFKNKQKFLSAASLSTPKYQRSIFKSKSAKLKELNKALEPFGYAYYPPQDIFYSIMNCWQRNFGYCELYDEAAATLSMIIDCEPVYFDYAGKHWLIEFWKGQYGMNTGCEIGVYNTTGPILNIPGIFNGTFYNCAEDEDHIRLGCNLWKNGDLLFYRNEVHWWLTGFKLGEFSHPSELTMNCEVTLKDSTMLKAFVKGIKKTGYSESELTIVDNTVKFVFDKPRSKQVSTRTSFIEAIMQSNNRRNCEAYQFATDKYFNTIDKIEFIKVEAPKLYRKILNIGNSKELFSSFDIIKKYLSPKSNKDDDDILKNPKYLEDNLIPETDYDDYIDGHVNDFEITDDNIDFKDYYFDDDIYDETLDILDDIHSVDHSKDLSLYDDDDIDTKTDGKKTT